MTYQVVYPYKWACILVTVKLLRMCTAAASCRPCTRRRALPPACARCCMRPSPPETGVEERSAQSTRCCPRHCRRAQALYLCTSCCPALSRSPSLPYMPCVWRRRLQISRPPFMRAETVSHLVEMRYRKKVSGRNVQNVSPVQVL